MYRDHTKVVQIGDKKIGGGNPILIQSMTNTKTEDVEATVRQILELEAAGCDIIRCAVPTMFILIIVLQLQQWKTVPIRYVSIREISEVQTVFGRLWMWQKNATFRSVLV